jgi:hypothetical protein
VNIIETLQPIYILIWAVIAAGIYYSFREHGKNQYNEGMADAVCMHHTGSLEYKIVINESGEEDIEIKINGGK